MDHALPRYPNGICVTADGRSLYVAESYLPGVSLIPIQPDGSAGPPEPVCELPRTVPDGVALDLDGTLYISCYRPTASTGCGPARRRGCSPTTGRASS